jgi:hypothetical protein
MAVLVAASVAWGAPVGYYLDLRMYLHTPDTFADRPLGALPVDKKIPISAPYRSIWYLRFTGWRPTQPIPEIVKLAKERDIPGLNFEGNRDLMNIDLEPLRELTGLRYLSLEGTGISDRGLLYLFPLQNLEVLHLNKAITDEGLATLARLHRLVELRLTDSQVTDAGMKVLKNFPGLQRLDLEGTQVTAKGLEALKGAPLKQLHLGPKMTDAASQALKSFSALVQLHANQAAFTDQAIPAIAALPRLHTLFLSPSVSDKGVAALARMRSLRRLDLTGVAMTNRGAASLSTLKDLEELALTRTQVGDTGLAALAGLQKLRYLEVSETAVTLSGFAEIAKLKALRVVSLSSQKKLRLGDLRALGQLPQLHTIIVDGSPLPPDALEFLRKEPTQARPAVWEWLIPLAEAADDLSDSMEVVQLLNAKENKGSRLSGLERIHYVESELDNIIPAPTMIGEDNRQDTEKNFLGEFTVESGGPNKKREKK